MEVTKNVVAVDIDNTVHESDITLNRVSMELFNSPFRWCQQPEWYCGTDSIMPMENALEVFNRLHDRDMIFLTDPYIGAREGLERIQNAGYTIEYFSDRKLDSYQDTHDWLVEHGLPNPEGLRCCKDKRADLLDNADRIVTVIDDRVRTLLYCQYELGIPKVFSLKQPYNRALTDAPGVFLETTWRDLAETFITEMGELRAGASARVEAEVG